MVLKLFHFNSNCLFQYGQIVHIQNSAVVKMMSRSNQCLIYTRGGGRRNRKALECDGCHRWGHNGCAIKAPSKDNMNVLSRGVKIFNIELHNFHVFSYFNIVLCGKYNSSADLVLSRFDLVPIRSCSEMTARRFNDTKQIWNVEKGDAWSIDYIMHTHTP